MALADRSISAIRLAIYGVVRRDRFPVPLWNDDSAALITEEALQNISEVTNLEGP